MRYKGRKSLLGMICLLLAVCLLCGGRHKTEAAQAQIYACDIHPCYRHPVSGSVEDSGGESSYATGQGMVESCIKDFGMVEKVGDQLYLTFQMGLVDYCSRHSFQVQTWGEEGWTDPAVGVTGQGSDDNGTTYDITVQIPAEKCVVRGTMYVDPMGRDVVFYLYPDNLTPSKEEGGANGMKAAMANAAAGQGSSSDQKAAREGGGEQKNPASDTQKETHIAADSEGAAQAQPAASAEGAKQTQTETGTVPAGKQESPGAVDTRAGLNLSTEGKDPSKAGQTSSASGQVSSSSQEQENLSAGHEGNGSGSFSVAEQILINIISWSVTGLILMGAGAVLLYILRKNWMRWGEEDPDDYSGLYRGDEKDDDDDR